MFRLTDVGAEIESLINAGAESFIGKAGEQYRGTPPTDRVTADAILQLGYTIGFRHIEKNSQRYGALRDRFAMALKAPIDVHFYCTPAGQPGFGWHYDAEEVFVLQVSGSKHWYLRKNSVHPWPLIEAIPANQCYQREQTPVEHCFLTEGDWLYIPGGYWHKTVAGAASASLSIGARASTAIDYFDFLRKRLIQSIFWRQRFPPPRPHSEESPQLISSKYRELIETFALQLTEEFLRPFAIDEFIEQMKTSNSAPLKGAAH